MGVFTVFEVAFDVSGVSAGCWVDVVTSLVVKSCGNGGKIGDFGGRLRCVGGDLWGAGRLGRVEQLGRGQISTFPRRTNLRPITAPQGI